MPVKLTERVIDTLEKLSNYPSWLWTFEAKPVTVPQVMDRPLLTAEVEHLNSIQIIAILQTALYQAGYSVQNLVYDVAKQASDFERLTTREVKREAKHALMNLRAEVHEWESFRRSEIRDRAESAPEVKPEGSIPAAVPATAWQQVPVDSSRVSNPPLGEVTWGGLHQPARAVITLATTVSSQCEPRFAASTAGAPANLPVPTSTAMPLPVQSIATPVHEVPACREPAPVMWRRLPEPAQRPWIDLRTRRPFDGTEPLEDRQKWWDNFMYLMQAGLWNAEECRPNLGILLTGPAEAWLDQLDAINQDWSALQCRFYQEFCVATGSAVDEYYSVCQKGGQTLRHTLWRLNAAAEEAKIDIMSHEGLQRHVARFIRVIEDPNARSALIGKAFPTIADLDEALRLFDEHREPDLYRQPASEPVEQVQEVPRAGACDFPVAYWMYGDDEDSDRNLHQGRRAAGAPRKNEPEIHDYLPIYWPGAGSAECSHPARPVSMRPQRDEIRCFRCQGYGHVGRDCPSRMIANPSNNYGYDVVSRWRKCSMCDQAHIDQECSLVKEVKEWARTKTQAVATDMPAGPVKQLQ